MLRHDGDARHKGRLKRKPSDLAVLGGAAAFRQPLHVGRPNVGGRDRLMQRIQHILDCGRLTNNGQYVHEFERRVADIVDQRHCIATCNATVALEIAIRALGMTGEVIVPSMTFVATAHALQWQEIKPVFADVTPGNFTLDPAAVERHVGPRTSGIIGVHLWGRPCDTEALARIARRHRLKLLYDASHAFSCRHGSQPIGGFGDAEVFSFHATKFVNAFEGGAIVTNDDTLAHRARLMRNFGFAGQDSVVYLGINGKMSEVCAAMGLTSFEDMDRFITINRRNFESYRQRLQAIPGIRLLEFDASDTTNWQYVTIEVSPSLAGLGRDDLMRVLHLENVLARRYFYPGCHRMEPYRTLYPNAGLHLPVTEAILDKVLTLPTGSTITADQIRTICQIIRLAVQFAPLIPSTTQIRRLAA